MASTPSTMQRSGTVYIDSLTNPDGMAEYTVEDMPEYLQDWLGRIGLLYGVPFNYLVPNERLLPKESIRFFYLDRNWTERLVDGALSVGKTTTREYAHHEEKKEDIRKALQQSIVTFRPRLRGENLDTKTFKVGSDLTGFLLRSAVVRGWPGLEARAFSRFIKRDHPSNVKLQLLRMERLAPDILLCIFAGVPKYVELEEPREGIQFGIDQSSNSIQLRHTIDEGGESEDANADEDGKAGENVYELNKAPKPGQDPVEKARVTVPYRNQEERVLDVYELKKRIANSLPDIGVKMGRDLDSTGYDDSARLSPAEFAVQLLQFPYVQPFNEAEAKPTLENGSGKFNLFYGKSMQVMYAKTSLETSTLKLLVDLSKGSD